MRIRFLAILGFPVVLCAQEPLKTDTRPINSFESEPTGITTKDASYATTTEGASDGARALHLTFRTPAPYPAVIFDFDTPQDFRGYGGLAFDVYNPGPNMVAFNTRIDSSTEADGSGNHSRTGRGSIDGGQRATYVIPFGTDPSTLKVKALPGFGAFRSVGSLGKGPFDLSHVVNWQVFLNLPADNRDLIIDNVRLVPGHKEDFSNLVDKYGQYTRETWPGKVTGDQDFAAQSAEEDRDLAAHPVAKDRDIYGGWASGPKLDATGFFRVAKHDDKWTFVDPEGRLFLSFGPTCIGTTDVTTIKGREELFNGLPADDPALKAATTADGVDFLKANLIRKYGSDFTKPWLDRSYIRLLSWGFNTIAAFSSWGSIGNGRVPYTLTVWPSGKHARVTWGTGYVRGMDDPFDPQFAADVAAAVEGQAKRAKDDPFCIGYFVGNEEAWGYHKNDPASHYGLAIGALKAEAKASPAKRAILQQLQEKYRDISALNAAWETSFASWSAMEAPVSLPGILRPKVIADLSAFLSLYAETYFRTVNEAIKQADPNHLYLGCRFAGYSPEVLAAAAKHCDVLSFNIYRDKLSTTEWAILDAYDKPVLIGEFHFGSTDRGVFDTGLFAAADQKSRGVSYDAYIRSVLAHPKFVGAHWFQYADQPATGRAMDGENAGIGFVSITDTPHQEFIDSVRKTNAEIYSYRFQK
ncbi:beta-galactosidase [Terrimicrobium sacchariphilum]|uniref:Beta-galactosidase n=1 Tax=Terrimicrobium sacchariphilum TaxID=690879 RepID=A0A146G4B3_TERSA|nr:beta-galactosidase [Terrimicrobium sacchariphilum]GAT31867.1 beta-galactosidase [Terrimicrobium sacchariphilum]